MDNSLKQIYNRDGFVIVHGLVAPEEMKALQDASERVIAATRSGAWPHRRVVGKQFPPFGDADPDSWGVQHVMHPDLHEPIFARWYTGDALIGVITKLLECDEQDLQMELFNLLINPVSHKFALRWHRDDVREDASEEVERSALQRWHYGVQWNTALYEDSCLFVVPGSHRFPRSVEQRAHSSSLTPPDEPLEMPGATRVTLEPGDTVFYNSNLLHCATYDPSERRATLHACMGDVRGGTTRARNILQHGLKWMKDERFRKSLSDGRSKEMLDRVLNMAGEVKDDTGYSLEG